MGNLSALRLPDPDIFVCLLLSYLLHGKRYALISGASGRQGKGLTDRSVSPSDTLAVMSVDLGSESMKVAIVKPGVPMEIVLNK